ncbi:MAG: hypothetical protein ACXW1M_02785 [Acidimicrobiia bacterium]
MEAPVTGAEPLEPTPGSVALDALIPSPGLRQLDTVDLALPIGEAWAVMRHTDLGGSPSLRALFAIRTLPSRLGGRDHEPLRIRLDDLVSTEDRPGFSVLVDEPPHAVAVGAIGTVWRPEIDFVHVTDAEEYVAFAEPGYVRVAWAIELTPLGDRATRVTVEVRVDATDVESWKRFRRYFRFVGPFSRFIRRDLLATLGRRFGLPRAEHERALPGDDLLADAADQATDGITISATPEQIWPWLVQMGCRRAGFYSLDLFDNGGKRSAREIHADLQHLEVGDVIPATPDGDDGFEVLRIERDHLLVLGGLYDTSAGTQLAFSHARPERFWQVTWGFVLEPLDPHTTRLIVRARAVHDGGRSWHARWIRPVHHLMETTQLRRLAARAEGQLSNDDWRDVVEGAGGAAIMAAAVFTPFLRPSRSHWGLDETAAARELPGDGLVPHPRWQWTHGIEVDAPADAVWPWIAQVGADKAGFYSYQWLENIPGCDVRNAETIHDEWAVKPGDQLMLHPKMPPLPVEVVEPGRCFVAHAPPEPGTDRHDQWADVSWLFLVEPLASDRCRVISRYRCATSDDLATRLQLGPALIEPIGFAMDRRMLRGIKQRSERIRRPVHTSEVVP